MNSGPTGSVTVSRKMRSIVARVSVSTDHPAVPAIARN